MAVQTITYDNKVALNTNPDIADINKVTDSDMNEIKSVANNNANNIGDLSTLTTTTTSSIVGAVNEINSTRLVSLWTNSAPTSAFGPQNVQLSSSDYDYLIWIFKFHRSTNRQKSVMCLKGAGAIADMAWDYGAGGTYYLAEYYRQVNCTDNTHYAIGDDYVRYNGWTNTGTDNNYLIPIAVYGGKF